MFRQWQRMNRRCREHSSTSIIVDASDWLRGPIYGPHKRPSDSPARRSQSALCPFRLSALNITLPSPVNGQTVRSKLLICLIGSAFHSIN